MVYLAEFRTHGRAVVAAGFGIGAGVSLSFYVSSLFLPHLSAEFGWTDAQFALTGVAALAAVIGVLVAGRLADRFGVRPVAGFGIVAMPLCWLGFTRLGPDIAGYYALFATLLLLGTTTTSVVYARVVAERFFTARGLALALAISGAPLVGGLSAPIIDQIIAAHGWRAGYAALAAISAVGGSIAWMLLPGGSTGAAAAITPNLLSSRAAYAEAFGSRALWVLLGAMALCNLPGLMISLQLKPLLTSLGLPVAAAVAMVSVYATGVIVGRFCCGLALDRFLPHKVAAGAMILPALGFALLVAAPGSLPVTIIALALVGISQGAEGDIAAYLVARHFRFAVFGTVFGLVVATLGLSAAMGGVLLSGLLGATGSYLPFLVISSVAVATGSLTFLLLGRERPV
ncbi:MAG: MFS transporter [Sandarakinorhabdus sp.]|nr:MFS transporter [Sandarakinorhabdus sp.]